MTEAPIPVAAMPALDAAADAVRAPRSPGSAFAGGALIGTLGGLIGLGGAEFRLPLLIGPYRFAPLEAVVLNKAMSLIVVASALPFRTATVPVSTLADHAVIVADLLAGSLLGAWFGAGWATKLGTRAICRVIAVLLVVVAGALLFGHGAGGAGVVRTGAWPLAEGVAAGFGIGVVASLMGVAGGELLIPTLVLLFGVDVESAGSLSLAVSLPTMIVGFVRYGTAGALATLARNRRFVAVMAIGSIVGSFAGGRLLGLVSADTLLPLLALILVLSSVKVWRHG